MPRSITHSNHQLLRSSVTLIGGRLLDAARKDGLTVGELKELLSRIGEVSTSQRETARSLMAFTLITVVGVALAALLLSSAGDAGDLRKTVITLVLTLLGTIVGFYFGTRAAETGAAPTASAPTPISAPAPTASAPTPTAWEPVAEEEAAPVAEEATPTDEQPLTLCLEHGCREHITSSPLESSKQGNRRSAWRYARDS
jgi:hypothetical protein